jgi:hemin uptake protein HemP
MLPPTATNAMPAKVSGPSGPAPARHLESQALFAGANEVVIAHGGEQYRLRITRQGKLILTK